MIVHPVFGMTTPAPGALQQAGTANAKPGGPAGVDVGDNVGKGRLWQGRSGSTPSATARPKARRA
ncbi:hypothetical protein BOS5A_230838 [Bosea sp. EC-HK365B]|nr:hypothetical protein BOS5A_230838 [Bosea sp. EC-HK365B]